MDIWTIADLTSNFVDSVLLVLILGSFFTRRIGRAVTSIIVFSSCFGSMTLLYFINAGMSYTLGVYLFLSIVLGFVLYRGSMVTRVFIPILFGALMIVSDLLVMVLLQGVFPDVDTEVLMQRNIYRVYGMFLSKLLFFIMIRIAARFAVRKSIKLPLQYTIMLLLVPITSIIVLDTILKLEISRHTILDTPVWIAISAGCLLCINILVYFLFESLCKDFDKISTYRMMEQQVDLLENHLKEMEASKQETQRIWHDIKNHVTSIRGLVKLKKYNELVRYTDAMFEQLGHAMDSVQTGHPVVDALLASKVALAKQSDIRMDIDAILPPSVPVEAFDISVVLSNALDNAIEACSKVTTADRHIEVIMHVKKECLFITVENPYTGQLKPDGDLYDTTKEESKGHGIGLSNIKRTLGKYNGHLKITTEAHIFKLSAIMFFDKAYNPIAEAV